MDNVSHLRLSLYSVSTGLPIYAVKVHDEIKYFLVYDSVDYNPSNHRHYIELRKCKLINSILMNPVDFDSQVLSVKLSELPDVSFSFPNHLEWFKVR